MGNALVRVCQTDRSLKYYKAPISVMEILKEHSECVLVSVSKGKTNVLSRLDLLPAGKFYIIPRDVHPSTTTTGDFQLPPDRLCVCLGKPCVRIMTIYFFSAASLLVPKKKWLYAMVRGVGNLKLSLQCRSRCGRQTRSDDDHAAESKSQATSIFPLAPSPAIAGTPGRKTPFSGTPGRKTTFSAGTPGRKTPFSSGTPGRKTPFSAGTPGRKTPFSAGTPGKKTTFKELTCIVPEVHSTPNWGKASTCWSPLVQLFHGNVVRGEDDGFSKEKWLEDMIRGADNQWRKIKLEQAFLIEDAEGADSPRLRLHAYSPWAVCLPSSSRSPWTSSSRQDEYMSPLSAIEDSPNPSPRQQQTSHESSNVVKFHHASSNVVEIQPDPSNVVEIHHDQKLKQKDYREDSLENLILTRQESHGISARRAVIKEALVMDQVAEKQLTLQQEGFHGASKRRAAIAVLQLEIEQAELDDKNKQLLKQKMEELENLSLLKSSSSPPLGSAPNFLQKYVQKADALLSNYTRLRKEGRYDWSPT